MSNNMLETIIKQHSCQKKLRIEKYIEKEAVL